MYNKFLSFSLLLCLSASISFSLFAMESNNSSQQKATYDVNGCAAILSFLTGQINIEEVSINDQNLRNAFDYCFNNSGNVEATHRDNSINWISECLSDNNCGKHSEVVALLNIKLGLSKQEQSPAQVPAPGSGSNNKNKSVSNFNGYKVSAVGLSAVAAFAVRDNLKNLVVGTYNRVKRATIGAKNLAVRSAVGLKDAAVYKDGDVSKTKLAALGGTATVGFGAYVYNKKTNKIAGVIGNLSGKLTTALSTRYNGSVRAQALAKFAQDKYANVSAYVVGHKDNVKEFFVKDKYHNTYVSIIAVSGFVVLWKLMEKYFEKEQESAVTQLLITFGDASDMNQDAIDLQNNITAALVSGDANKLISIKDDSRDMLTADQQVLLDAAIEEIQNN